MRRYAIARYLTPEQRERAAAATYVRRKIPNACRWNLEDHWARGDTVAAARTENGSCPLGVALHPDQAGECPEPREVESELAITGENNAIWEAACRFIHDIDCGKIAPEDVPAALGVQR